MAFRLFDRDDFGEEALSKRLENYHMENFEVTRWCISGTTMINFLKGLFNNFKKETVQDHPKISEHHVSRQHLSGCTKLFVGFLSSYSNVCNETPYTPIKLTKLLVTFRVSPFHNTLRASELQQARWLSIFIVDFFSSPNNSEFDYQFAFC